MNIYTKYQITILIIALILATSACGTSTPEVSNTANQEVNVAESPVENNPVPENENVTTNDEPEVQEEVEPSSTLEPEKPANPDFDVLGATSYEESGKFYIVGEVLNKTDTPMGKVKLIATIYNADNNVVEVKDFIYTVLRVIPPGGKSPFRTYIDSSKGGTLYEFEVKGSPSEEPPKVLEILNLEDRIYQNNLYISGEVKNSGNQVADRVEFVITLYNAEGEVISINDTTYGGPFGEGEKVHVIPPGETILFHGFIKHWENFDHYDIQIQYMPDGG